MKYKKPRRKDNYKSFKVHVDESYEKYVERCVKHNVKPLDREKWQEIIVEGVFSIR